MVVRKTINKKYALISVFDKLIIDFATYSDFMGLYFFGNKNENKGIIT